MNFTFYIKSFYQTKPKTVLNPQQVSSVNNTWYSKMQVREVGKIDA